jgi:hypothetical protein
MTRRQPAGVAVAALILLAACTHHTTAPAGDGSAGNGSSPAAMWAAAAEPKVEECELRSSTYLDHVRAVSPTPDLLQAYRDTVPYLGPAGGEPKPGTNPHYYAARYRGSPVGVVLVDQSGGRGLPSRVAFVFSAQGKPINVTGGPTYTLGLPLGCPTGRP